MLELPAIPKNLEDLENYFVFEETYFLPPVKRIDPYFAPTDSKADLKDRIPPPMIQKSCSKDGKREKNSSTFKLGEVVMDMILKDDNRSIFFPVVFCDSIPMTIDNYRHMKESRLPLMTIHCILDGATKSIFFCISVKFYEETKVLSVRQNRFSWGSSLF